MKVRLLSDGKYALREGSVGQVFEAKRHYKSFLVKVPTTYSDEVELCFLPHMVEVVDEKGIQTVSGCYCIKCGYRVGDNNDWTQALVHYCSSCGQRLKW